MTCDGITLLRIATEAKRRLEAKFKNVSRENIEDSVSFAEEKFLDPKSKNEFESEQKIRAWVVQVSKNHLLRTLQRRKKFAELSSLQVEPSYQQSEIIQLENVQFIRSMSNNLSKRNQEVIEKTLEGKNIQEIADELGKPYDTIKHRLERSTKQMNGLWCAESNRIAEIKDF